MPILKAVHALSSFPGSQLPAAERAMGDFLFADRSHPVLEVLPNDGGVDTLTPDCFVEHNLFTPFVKCADNRHRFDGAVVDGA